MLGILFLQTFNVRLRIWKLCDGQWGVLEGPEEGWCFQEADAAGGGVGAGEEQRRRDEVTRCRTMAGGVNADPNYGRQSKHLRRTPIM